MKTRNTIDHATACYTGGNVYVYCGQLSDGRYFIADELQYMLFTDTDPVSVPNTEWFCGWHEKHCADHIGAKWCELPNCLWNKMLDWIITHKPNGSYETRDLEERRAIYD